MKALLIISLLFVVSCASGVKVSYIDLEDLRVDYNKKYGKIDKVQILKQLPDHDNYDTIGRIEARGYIANTEEQFFNKLKEAAKQKGANAIVIDGNRTHTEFNVGFMSIYGHYDAPKYARATAIHLK